MTIQEAYKKARVLSERDIFHKRILDKCFDLGNSWAFSFRISILFKDPLIVGGIAYYTVNKSTGKTGILSSNPRDMEKVWNGTPVDTKPFRTDERKELSNFEKVVSKILYPF